MAQGLLTGKTISRVKLQQADHQLQGFLRKTGHVAFLECFRLGDLRELQSHESRVLIKALHLFLGQHTEHLLNQVELVHLRVTWEQWLSITKLAHDAPDGPHIDLRSIICVPQQ